MAYTTEAAVLEILNLGTSAVDADVTPFLNTAHLIVEEQLATSDLTVARLTEIELWLAAHFCSIKNRITSDEKAGSVSESYQYCVDVGFSVTIYGQQAMMLDTTGTLAAMNQRAKTGKGAFRFTHQGEDITTDYMVGYVPQ